MERRRRLQIYPPAKTSRTRGWFRPGAKPAMRRRPPTDRCRVRLSEVPDPIRSRRGEAGLIWNRILLEEDDFARLLKTPHFAMAEFDIPHLRAPEQQPPNDFGPGDLDWATADYLNLELIADKELTAEDLEELGLPS